MSKSQISRFCMEIDERVDAFLARPLKSRGPASSSTPDISSSGKEDKAVTLVVAVNDPSGNLAAQSPVGRWAGNARFRAWPPASLKQKLFRSLTDRGLRGVKLVKDPSQQIWPCQIASRARDDHRGPRAAARRVFHAGGVTRSIRGGNRSRNIQRPRIDQLCKALARPPAKQRTAVAAMLKTIFAQESRTGAEAQRSIVAGILREKQPKLSGAMDTSPEYALCNMSVPREHWTQIASTNPLRRTNREVKRRADVIRIFPNTPAIACRADAGDRR
ncbi:hypothetical protein GCM10011415_21080 [Salipiger pallidus]|uniref:Mutator family transposase n=1 Tax=Salipiger pallidus TaxID=1775170 RepID=A0A8J2ZJW8_9RHOB|nr:hypothetical protein GCM10011415_21080 [Salipiger pallidus]